VAHGKASPSRTTTKDARQSLTITHGKERSRRTAKTSATAKAHTSAVYVHYAMRHCDLHDKGAFAVQQPFAMRDSSFFIFFIYVLFFLLLMFISQLVLYFVDYLLVLYPCFLQYNILYIVIPPTYIRVSEQTMLRGFFKSVHRHPPHIYQGFGANHALGKP
jgi:hypothetical protein